MTLPPMARHIVLQRSQDLLTWEAATDMFIHPSAADVRVSPLMSSSAANLALLNFSETSAPYYKQWDMHANDADFCCDAASSEFNRSIVIWGADDQGGSAWGHKNIGAHGVAAAAEAILPLSALLRSYFPRLKTADEQAPLSATPPMGWNPYNHYGCGGTEAEMRKQTQALLDLDLHKAGFKYINLDCGWASKNRTGAGRIQGDPKRFPSGVKELADWVHSKGLMFGIYTDIGGITCGGGAGILGHETSDASD